MTKPADRIEEIRKRAEAATPGPWLERHDSDYYQEGTYLGIGGYAYKEGKEVPGNEYFKQNVCRIESNDEDKEFIANAREDVPYLLDQLSQLQAENEKLEADSVRKIWEISCLKVDLSREREKAEGKPDTVALPADVVREVTGLLKSIEQDTRNDSIAHCEACDYLKVICCEECGETNGRAKSALALLESHLPKESKS